MNIIAFSTGWNISADNNSLSHNFGISSGAHYYHMRLDSLSPLIVELILGSELLPSRLTWRPRYVLKWEPEKLLARESRNLISFLMMMLNYQMLPRISLGHLDKFWLQKQLRKYIQSNPRKPSVTTQKTLKSSISCPGWQGSLIRA